MLSKPAMVFSGPLLAMGLSACATDGTVNLPSARQSEFYFATDVIYTLECELANALQAVQGTDMVAQYYSNRTVGVTMTLTVTEVSGPNGSATLIIPVSGTRLTLSPSAGQNATGKRVMDVKHSYNSSNLEPCKNSESSVSDGMRKPEDPPKLLKNNLGLQEWINQVAIMMRTIGETPTSVSYNATFTLKEDRGLNATIAQVGDDSATVGGVNNRTMSHQVAVTFGEKIAPTREKPSRQEENRTFQIQENFLERIAE